MAACSGVEPVLRPVAPGFWRCRLVAALGLIILVPAWLGRAEGQPDSNVFAGMWTWVTPTLEAIWRTNIPMRTNTLTLIVEHAKAMGRLIASAPVEDLYPPFPRTRSIEHPRSDVPIEDLEIDRDRIRFTLKYVFKGRKVVSKNAGVGSAVMPVEVGERRRDTFRTTYSGKIQGDTILGKAEYGWNGQRRIIEWVAKRLSL